MKGVAVWFSGATLAFLLTAGTFLLLANIATVSSEKSLAPEPPEAASTPVIELELNPDQLVSLEPEPDQSLDLTVRNEGNSPLTNLNVTLRVFSENTALSGSRYYQQMVEKVPANGTADISFGFNLSEPEQSFTGRPPAEPAREILEIKATTPDGISTVKTVILPP